MAALTSAPPTSPAMTLVADIGGTNARFALTPQDASRPALQLAAVRRVADFATLDAAIADYVATLPPALRPRRAVLAVASPVLGDAIAFTNSRWSFSIGVLRDALRLRALHVINDFAAVAWALPALANDDVETLGTAPATTTRVGMRAVVGPGTGLGVAALFEADAVLRVLASEGGHAGFAPHDEDEVALHAFLRARHGRVSWERLLCGEGLSNLHDAMRARAGLPDERRTPEAVTAAARDGDPHARAATRSFCAALGSFAGDVALTYGAWDGVWLAGAMLAQVLDADGVRVFRQRFEAKGRFAARLRAVPTWRIVRDDVGSLGAAVYGNAFARGSTESSTDAEDAE